MLEVQLLEANKLNEIDELSQQNSSTLIYTSPRFINLLAEYLHATPQLLVAREEGRILGYLPFLYKQGPWGPVFNSLPYYGSNGGVVVSEDANDEVKISLLQAFYQYAALQEAASATIITNPLCADYNLYEEYSNFDVKDERIGQFTHFPFDGTPEALLAQFESPRPRNIRKASKLGVKVRASNHLDDLDFMYRTHVANMHAIGGLAKEQHFFHLVPKLMLCDDWSMYIAELENQKIAGLLLFQHGKTVEYFTPVIVEEHRSSQALSLVIYQAMLDAMQSGFSQWNWGGTWLTQDGVYQFKKKWGTKDIPYFYYCRVFNREMLKQSKEAILKHYVGFYTVPFSALGSK